MSVSLIVIAEPLSRKKHSIKAEIRINKTKLPKSYFLDIILIQCNPDLSLTRPLIDPTINNEIKNTIIDFKKIQSISLLRNSFLFSFIRRCTINV